MDLTDTSVAFAVTPLVEGFRFLLSRAMSGEKKQNARKELVIGFFDISREPFHSPVRKKKSLFECHMVMHHAHHELPCSTV